MSRVVHAEKLLAGRFRRVEASYQPVETRGEQPVLDRSEAIGTLGMLLSHLVQEALRVRDEGEAHGLPCPCEKPGRVRPCRPFDQPCKRRSAARVAEKAARGRIDCVRQPAPRNGCGSPRSSPDRNGRREPCMVRTDNWRKTCATSLSEWPAPEATESSARASRSSPPA